MFRKLHTLEEARQVIRKHVNAKPSGVESVPLLAAFNRVLAEDVVASLDIPPFSRSTVDGYAVKAEDTFGAEENQPVKLKVCAKVSAGEPPKTAVRDREAAEIVTGAPIPKGADAAVMLEYTERKADVLSVHSAVVKGENVMKVGSDIRKGETLLKEGQMLQSREIGVLAAVGSAKAEVFTVPRIAVLSTGAEITEPGKRLPPARVYDINAYSLCAAVQESGGHPVYLGVFPDVMEEMKTAIREALATADAVVTSGGVSVGPKDLMPKVLDSLGKPGVVICGVAIKPGKPLTVAVIGGKPVFALPGHPTSALLVFHLLVHPIIQSMAGRAVGKPAEAKALAAMRMFPAKGRRTFVMVALKKNKSNRLVAEPIPTGLSGAITTLAKADGFVEIAEDTQFVDAGEEVDVQLFKKKQ